MSAWEGSEKRVAVTGEDRVRVGVAPLTGKCCKPTAMGSAVTRHRLLPSPPFINACPPVRPPSAFLPLLPNHLSPLLLSAPPPLPLIPPASSPLLLAPAHYPPLDMSPFPKFHLRGPPALFPSSCRHPPLDKVQPPAIKANLVVQPLQPVLQALPQKGVGMVQVGGRAIVLPFSGSSR